MTDEIRDVFANAEEFEPETEPGIRLDTVRADQVERKRVDWLWHDRIALGTLTVLAGDPGLGKSLLAMDMAARVSVGRAWPDGSPCPLGSALIISAEDAADRTIVPRLHAAGADLSRIRIFRAMKSKGHNGQTVEHHLSLAHHASQISDTLRDMGDARLLIIDPISAYLRGIDTHRNADTRAALAPLVAVAAQAGIALVAITHLNKGAGAKALYRVMGSLAFVAAARAVYLVCEDRHDPSRRLFFQDKNNLSSLPKGSGFAYAVRADASGTPNIVWDETPLQIDPTVALAAPQAEYGPAGAKGEAMEWLAAVLADGPVDSVELQRSAEADGIAWATVRRAGNELEVTKEKAGFQGRWQWSLAQRCSSDANDAHD